MLMISAVTKLEQQDGSFHVFFSHHSHADISELLSAAPTAVLSKAMYMCAFLSYICLNTVGLQTPVCIFSGYAHRILQTDGEQWIDDMM